MGLDPITGAALIGGASSLIGGLTGGKSSGGGSSQQQNTAPWGPQQPYITGAYKDAQGVYNQRTALGPYTGPYVASGNGIQQYGSDVAAQFGSGEGASTPYNVAAISAGLLGAAPQYTANAGGIASTGLAGPNAGLYGAIQGYGTGTGGGLSSALNAAGINGAQSLGGFTQGLQGAAATAASDPTARTVADAGQFANNPTVDASVNAANARIEQTLNEQTVPGLNRQAAMGGALNSSRAGIAEGLANENAAIAEGSTDAAIRSNAYNTGVGAATNQYATGLNGAITANSLGYTGSNTTAQQDASLALNAANSGLGQNLNYGTENINSRLAANAELGNAAGLGISGAGSAITDANGNFNLLANAGNEQQQYVDQPGVTNALDAYNAQDTHGQQALNDYFGIVGKPQGSQADGSSQTQLPPNYAGNALGGAAAGAGLYQRYFNSGQATATSDPGTFSDGLYGAGSLANQPW